jgi:hypothetical protein
MGNKRYQVFVSSTYTDLIDERAEVIQALLALDMHACRNGVFSGC